MPLAASADLGGLHFFLAVFVQGPLKAQLELLRGSSGDDRRLRNNFDVKCLRWSLEFSEGLCIGALPALSFTHFHNPERNPWK